MSSCFSQCSWWNFTFFFYFVVCFFICVVGIKIHIFVFSFYSLHLFAVAACLHLLSDAIHNFFPFILISSSIFFFSSFFCFYFLFSVLISVLFFKGLKLMRFDVISLHSEIIMNTSCDELTFNITSLLITFSANVDNSFSMLKIKLLWFNKRMHDVNQLANTHAFYNKVQMCWFDTSVCEWQIKIIAVNNT